MNKRTFIKGLGAASLAPMVGTAKIEPEGLQFTCTKDSWSKSINLMDWRNVNYIPKNIISKRIFITVPNYKNNLVVLQVVNKYVSVYFMQVLSRHVVEVSSKDELLSKITGGTATFSFKGFYELFATCGIDFRQQLASKLNSCISITSDSFKIADKRIPILSNELVLFTKNASQELNVYNELVYKDSENSIFAVEFDIPNDYQVYDIGGYNSLYKFSNRETIAYGKHPQIWEDRS